MISKEFERYVDKEGRMQRSTLAMDIKYGKIKTKDEIQNILNKLEAFNVDLDFFGDKDSVNKLKKPKSEWNKNYLDKLSYAVISEMNNPEYYFYLLEVSTYINQNSPTKFQKVKAGLIEVFTKLLDGIEKLLLKMKDKKFKRILLNFMQKAKDGIATAKSLTAAKPELVEKLRKDAEFLKSEVDRLKSNEAFICALITSESDDLLTPANESFSDLSQFIEDPERFLSLEYRKSVVKNKNLLYSAPVGTGGDTFLEVTKACQELCKVNAYSEALALALKFQEKLLETRNGVSKEDRHNIELSLEELESIIFSIQKQRDDYMSKRKSTIARFSMILQR